MINKLVETNLVPSSGGRQIYVKPCTQVFEMEIEGAILGSSDLRMGNPSVGDWGSDEDMGSGTVTDPDQ